MTTRQDEAHWRSLIRDVPDFPQPGIRFRDITPLLRDAGAFREIIGSGTLFADASLLFGPAFKFMETQVMPPDVGILMMILPPGGFLAVGLLLALKRYFDLRAGKAISMGGAHSVA